MDKHPGGVPTVLSPTCTCTCTVAASRYGNWDRLWHFGLSSDYTCTCIPLTRMEFPSQTWNHWIMRNLQCRGSKYQQLLYLAAYMYMHKCSLAYECNQLSCAKQCEQFNESWLHSLATHTHTCTCTHTTSKQIGEWWWKLQYIISIVC